MAGLEPLYRWGFTPRHGQFIMVAGRSGSQKSGLALYWVEEMGLPTLYVSADMSAFTASARLASMSTNETTEQIEAAMKAGHKDRYLDALADSKITFSFGSPIHWRALDEEIEAYVELYDAYPQVIVVDNLMDVENAESDYTEQMAVMSSLTELTRHTGSTVIVMHHASDKSFSDSWMPPARKEIKNGLGEKPELVLTVALDNQTNDYRIAVVKQRMGRQDPDARDFVLLKADPEHTRFYTPQDWEKRSKQ